MLPRKQLFRSSDSRLEIWRKSSWSQTVISTGFPPSSKTFRTGMSEKSMTSGVTNKPLPWMLKKETFFNPVKLNAEEICILLCPTFWEDRSTYLSSLLGWMHNLVVFPLNAIHMQQFTCARHLLAFGKVKVSVFHTIFTLLLLQHPADYPTYIQELCKAEAVSCTI